MWASFPYRHTIEVTYKLSHVDSEHTLDITTTIHNTGGAPMPISFGWHPYLQLPDSAGHDATARASWRLRTPHCVRHVHNEHLLPTGNTVDYPEIDDVIGHRTYDDHFALGDDRTFVLSDAEHRITVAFDKQYPHLQMYVPPLPSMDAPGFVCIEPMTAPSNSLVDGGGPWLAENATFIATFSISIAISLDTSLGSTS